MDTRGPQFSSAKDQAARQRYLKPPQVQSARVADVVVFVFVLVLLFGFGAVGMLP